MHSFKCSAAARTIVSRRGFLLTRLASSSSSSSVRSTVRREYTISQRSFLYSSDHSLTTQRSLSLCVRGGAGERSASSSSSEEDGRQVSSPLLKKGHRVSCFTTDATYNDTELPRVLNRYPVTGCAAIGWRPYMEDEALIHGDVVGVFDGHGGASVSRYVRQNLYGHIQTILPRVVEDRLEDTNNHGATNENDSQITAPETTTTTTTPSPQDYERTIRLALEKINNEVMRIVHWSYQGSTAVVCWLHQATTKSSTIAKGESTTIARTLVAANIGDSRLVLSRDGRAIALSRDHKPDDPIEMLYIESQGGKVTYPSGIPRVNGIMALSRAIGDRSETPCIRAEPDLIVKELSQKDDFYVLATDGLWDVMTNQEVVNFLRECYDGDLSDESRQELTKKLVLEALSRGAEDNITIVIVWLR